MISESQPCVRCHQSDTSPVRFLLKCCECERFWHHKCHIPELKEDELIKLILASGKGQREGSLETWVCKKCSKRRAANGGSTGGVQSNSLLKKQVQHAPLTPVPDETLQSEHLAQPDIKPPSPVPKQLGSTVFGGAIKNGSLNVGSSTSHREGTQDKRNEKSRPSVSVSKQPNDIVDLTASSPIASPTSEEKTHLEKNPHRNAHFVPLIGFPAAAMRSKSTKPSVEDSILPNPKVPGGGSRALAGHHGLPKRPDVRPPTHHSDLRDFPRNPRPPLPGTRPSSSNIMRPPSVPSPPAPSRSSTYRPSNIERPISFSTSFADMKLSSRPRSPTQAEPTPLAASSASRSTSVSSTRSTTLASSAPISRNSTSSGTLSPSTDMSTPRHSVSTSPTPGPSTRPGPATMPDIRALIADMRASGKLAPPPDIRNLMEESEESGTSSANEPNTQKNKNKQIHAIVVSSSEDTNDNTDSHLQITEADDEDVDMHDIDDMYAEPDIPVDLLRQGKGKQVVKDDPDSDSSFRGMTVNRLSASRREVMVKPGLAPDWLEKRDAKEPIGTRDELDRILFRRMQEREAEPQIERCISRAKRPAKKFGRKGKERIEKESFNFFVGDWIRTKRAMVGRDA